ncbi:MAG: hypothetical protein QM602_03970 [Microbacterium sp.]
MGGRRVTVVERPVAAHGDEPIVTVSDEGGLWSFELHGAPHADVVIVLLPAMGVPARYYDTLAGELLNAGAALARVDFLARRVQADPSRPLDGFAALVEECLPAVFTALREYLPRANAAIVGHSLGGQLGLIAAGRFCPEVPVVLAASGSAWHRAFPGIRRWTYLFGSQAIGGAARALGHWPGDRLGFGGRQPGAVVRDWSRVVRTGRYAAGSGTFDYEAAIADYRGELLAVDVAGDVLAPRTATDALLAKAPRARITRMSYTPSRVTAKPGSHFTWVRDRDGLSAAIIEWVRALRD